ncbi:gas vesicle protein GvpJ [Rhodococcus sp. NPDC003318]|uniref:gas vesicle protein GvpJ n=1 Tax=Rhodococcus sp. NPDC003318 TaxID=3364503 RepID=UPI0036BA30A7
MTIATQGGGGGGLSRPSSSGLADVIDTILDKGLVIDAFVRASLVGIELVTIDARIVVASVDTYLRFAQAVNRMEISQSEPVGLPGLVGDITQGGSKQKTKGALEAAGETVSDFLGEIQDARRDKADRSRKQEER